MAISAEITRKLDDGTVQVDISSKNTAKRYFSIPQNRADSFIDSYKKHEKTASVVTNISFPVSILGGVILTNLLIRKAVKSNVIKYILNTTGGILAAIGTMLGTGDYLDKKKADLMKQHKAKELFFNA